MHITKKPLLRAAAFALFFIVCAHAFCFFNLTYSGASVMVNAAKGTQAQIASGQYLQTIYWRVRGAISSPMLVGALCSAYLAAACACCAWLMRIEDRPLPVFLLCGALCVNPATASLFAASLHTADALLLAALLMCAAVALCVRPVHRLCPLLGAGLAAGALAMDPAVFPLGAGLLVLAAVAAVLHGDPARDILRSVIVCAAALAVGCALFAAGHFLMLRRSGMDSSASLQMPRGGSIFGAWLYPLAQLFAPLTAYAHLQIPVRIALFAACAAAIFLLMKRDARRGLAVLALALALPLALNMPVLSDAAAGQTRLSFALLDALAVLLLATLSARVMKTAGAAMGALLLGGVVFANQVYLKKNLEFESTLSVMTRVLARAEEVEGFMPGQTPAAIVGNLDGGALSAQRVGFEHLSALEAARSNYAALTAEDHIWYFWEVLGYPISLVSTYEQALLADHPDVIAMPAFPAEGCAKMVDGTLVIKLSEPGAR